MRPCQPSLARAPSASSRHAHHRFARSDRPIPALSHAGAPPDPLRRYLLFLRMKWWRLALSLLFFCAAAAAYLRWWPQSYVATAHLWAAGKVGLQLHEGTTYAEDLQNFDGTQVELLQSDEILRRALNRVRNALNQAVPTNSAGEPQPVKLRVSQIPKSALIELKARGPDEPYVLAFLNATLDEFLAYKKEVRAATSGDTWASVSGQIARQEAELKSSQEGLTAYMRDNNVAVLEEQAKAASAYLTQLLAGFSQLKLEYQLLDAASAGAGTGADVSLSGDLGLLDPSRLADPFQASAVPSPDLLSAQRDLEKNRILRAKLSRYLRPEHPKIAKLDQEIALGQRLSEYLSRENRDQLATAKQAAELKLKHVQETIHEWEAKVNSASDRIAAYERLKLEVDRLAGLHDRLQGLLQTVDVSRNLDQENLTVLDRPSQAKEAKLSAPLAISLGLACGLAAGLGIVLLAERSDERIWCINELTASFHEWIVGEIPELSKAPNQFRPALLAIDDNRPSFLEAHRQIRSALCFATDRQASPKLLLVTSAWALEGKTTVAANLARAFALSGSRVLLVDADLRGGVIHELFGLAPAPGLTNLLVKSSDLAACIVQTPLPNLWLLPRGHTVSNPCELLLASECDDLLIAFRRLYDWVILDSLPIDGADDTRSLAPKVDGVLWIVRQGVARARTIRRCLNQLYERQAPLMGMIFIGSHRTTGLQEGRNAALWRKLSDFAGRVR